MLLGVASSKTVKEQNLFRLTKEGHSTNPANLKFQVNLGKGPPKTARKHAKLPVDARNPYTGTRTPTMIEELLLFQKSNTAEEKLDTRLRLNVRADNAIYFLQTCIHIG